MDLEGTECEAAVWIILMDFRLPPHFQ